MTALEQIVTAAMQADEKRKQTALAILTGEMNLDGSREPQLLTKRQLAVALGVSTRTIDKYAPPRHMTPAGWRYYEADARDYIVAQKERAA